VAKLGNFQTPTGAKGNVFDVSSWFSLIVGAIVLILTFALGQNLANRIGASVPGVDSSIDRPWSQPQPEVQANNKPTRVVL
jgi:hypothetical protein